MKKINTVNFLHPKHLFFLFFLIGIFSNSKLAAQFISQEPISNLNNFYTYRNSVMSFYDSTGLDTIDRKSVV